MKAKLPVQDNNVPKEETKKKKKKKQKEVVIEESFLQEIKTDESNPLLLPSKKEKKKKKEAPKKEPKVPLSKKKQKQLQQIVARKEKSANRGALLQSLIEVQASAELRQKLQAQSTANKGIKRLWDGDEDKRPKKKISAVKGAAKKLKRSNQLPLAAGKPSEEDSNVFMVYTPTPRDEIIATDDECSEDDEEDVKEEVDKKPTNPAEESLETEEIPMAQEESTDDKQEEETVEAQEEVSMEDDGKEEETAETQENDSATDNNDEEEEDEEEDSSEDDGEDESEEEEAENTKEADDIQETAPEKSQEQEVVVPPLKINPNYVPVNRTPEIEKARRKLPILGMEQEIMEIINDNPIVIVQGETGSGKTTQVPQFLYEAGYAKDGKMIGITEPRRVAASAMSFRVSTEMALSHKEVSYLTRFEGTFSPETKILFMTDGVLMKMVEEDPFLGKFSTIIIDEAHERSIHSDILIGLLSKVVYLKNVEDAHLKKLIIMSATLNIEEFTNLLSIPPPIINVESRQYQVTNHFNKYTPIEEQYLDLAYTKICRMHRQLPDGGILVFVPGKNEIAHLMKKLRSTFPSRAKKQKKTAQEEEKSKNDKEEEEKPSSPPPQPNKISLDQYSIEPLEHEVQIEGLGNYIDDIDIHSIRHSSVESQKPLYVLPLYAKLPPQKQKLVFKNPPEGSRLCVIATNVAETSITIPNIKYVLDTGKVKQRLYDKVSGISKYQIMWISKASAAQRSGRAGRTSEGHCYKLYSSAVYQNEFPDHTPPEICLKPLDDIVLQLKYLRVRNVPAFPFPTKPSLDGIIAAGERLHKIQAIKRNPDSSDKEYYKGVITKLGEKMAHLPISPRFGLMVIHSRKEPLLLPYVIALVAAISTDELFLNPEEAESEEEQNYWKQVKQHWTSQVEAKKLGDLSLCLNAAVASEEAGMTAAFARKYGLRMKALKEIRQIRIQITKQMKKEFPDLEISSELKLAPPTNQICDLLRLLVLRSTLPYDQVARLMPGKKKGTYESLQLPGQAVYIHPNSILYKCKIPATYIAYQEMVESSQLFMKGVSIVNMEWISQEARLNNYNNCTYDKPLEEPSPRYCPEQDNILCYARVTMGNWDFPPAEILHPEETERYRWFGYQFLNGDVFPSMKELSNNWILPPKTMVETWAHLKPHCNLLYDTLSKHQIDTKAKLLKKWKKDSTFLKDIVEYWLNEESTNLIHNKWPPQ